MDLSTFRQLLSPAGQAVLRHAEELQPAEADFLAHFTRLSHRYPAELARLALEVAILRREAVDKFPFADRLYLNRQAMQQASAYPVSTYRSQRLRSFTRLVDLGCSIGGDTLAMASLAPTLGIDLDGLRLAMARANLEALGLNQQASFLQADLRQPLPLAPGADLALFFDPARRDQGRRIYSVRAYHPPLAVVLAWLPRFPALAVKISPGVHLEELNTYDAELEFISLHRELKEAVLWFGPLKTASRRATLLPGAHSLAAAALGAPPELPLSEPQAYIYEPDPAVLRAGLVASLGQSLGAAQLDEDIAYLTGAQPLETPFARRWKVEDWFPFQLKRLREALRQRRVGHVVVKKRGSPLQPEALIHDLRLSGDQQRVVFLTHLRGRPIVILAYPLELDHAA
jgi:SAM-dependent methyltransferase